MIAADKWKWFGNNAHLIVGSDCRFHLATQIGNIIVSTVGEYWPDESVREIFARSRGIILEGKGDYRRADYMKKVGYEEIGCDRKYETMVFKIKGGKGCSCGCGLPSTDFADIDGSGYNTAKDATNGHMKFCRKYARKQS